MQLKSLTFVKSEFLTEMAYTISNRLWPDVENYIEQVGGAEKWIIATQSSGTDIILKKILMSYFKTLLLPYKLILKDFGLTVINNPNKNYFGATDSYLFIKTNGYEKLPLVILDITINIANAKSINEIPRTLFHELSHLEQQCKVVINQASHNLLNKLPVNKILDISTLASYSHDTEGTTSTISSLDELGAYANDFALKLFNHFKLTLKSMLPEDRDMFLRSKIIPNYLSFMTEDLADQLALLSYNKKHYFLKQLVRQLKEFTNGLL